MKKLIGQMLIEDGIINEKQLEEALNIQKQDGDMIGVILVKLAYLDDDTLLEYLKMQGTYIRKKNL